MASHAHLVAWQEYVRLDLARYAEHTGGTGQLWSDSPASLRWLGNRRSGSTDEYAYTGPWHIVRKHVTTEFRQWVEEFEASERLTLTDFVARKREEDAARSYFDSPAHALDQLVELRRLTETRDALILDAARKGASRTEIADSIGLTRSQVHRIIAAADAADDAAAEPVPFDLAEVAGRDVVATELVEVDGEMVEVF